MMYQVENLPEGYVVSCYHDLHWHPLRNFGVRQGDAIAFRDWDCPKLTDTQLRALEKMYNKNVRYIRVSATRFIKEKEL